jgi:MFS family permease
MSFPDQQIQPSEPPRRRRATRRSSIPADAEGQAALVASLARRAYPSIELFVFALVCGVILGLGFLLDSQAVLLLGILVAPLMVPWVGFLLSILTGSVRFLFETVMALIISLGLVFIGGLIIGFVTLALPQMTHDNVYIHTRLWIPSLVVFIIGAITLVASFARSEEKPFLPSVLIAYAFFLPINAVGFGLSAGLDEVWLQGLIVFAVHLSLASIIGLITLFILRIRPSAGGMILSLITILLFVATLVSVAGAGLTSRSEADTSTLPASTPTNQNQTLQTLTPSLTLNPTQTPRVNTPTPGTPSPVPVTLDVTLPPSETPTITLTIQPTPTYARIQANEGGGANLREAPGPDGRYIMTLLNGTIVETYGEFEVVSNITWVKVYATLNGQQIEGWLLESVVAYATPAPNFGATSTPTP